MPMRNLMLALAVALGAAALGGCGSSSETPKLPASCENLDAIPPEDCTITGNPGPINAGVHIRSLDDLDPLCSSPCTRIDADVIIADVDGLEDLRAFGRIREITGRLGISFCSDLKSLQGLDALEQLSWLDLSNLPRLRSLDGLGSLRSLATVDLDHLSALEHIDALSNVELPPPSLIGLHVKILYSPKLQNLRGLRNVARFRRIELTGNHSLVDFDGFQATTEIEEELSVYFNKDLQSLDGLENLTSVPGLTITNNAKLSQCEAEAFAAQVTAQYTNISSNGPCD